MHTFKLICVTHLFWSGREAAVRTANQGDPHYRGTQRGVGAMAQTA
jgi:hypothetical protein